MNSKVSREIQSNYRSQYLDIETVYPSVFALKMFLGNNPKFCLRDQDFRGKKILDIGFGDGRDLLLFDKLGFESYGVEVDENVVAHTNTKFRKLGLNIETTVGFNDSTGYRSETFDYVFSVAALMYLRDDTVTLSSILDHVYDITNQNGYFLGTFTKSNSHISVGAVKKSHNVVVLEDPYYKVRRGQLYHLHHSKEEVYTDLSAAGFKEIGIFDYAVDWFGTLETAFMCVARK